MLILLRAETYNHNQIMVKVMNRLQRPSILLCSALLGAALALPQTAAAADDRAAQAAKLLMLLSLCTDRAHAAPPKAPKAGTGESTVSGEE